MEKEKILERCAKICFSCMEQLSEANGKCHKCGHDNRLRTNGPGYLPGLVLADQYVVGKALGRGGFGITYIGYDLFLERKIAIKEYYPSDISRRNPETYEISPFDKQSEGAFRSGIERAKREASIAVRMEGIPNVVRTYGVIETNGSVYIMMEYIDGITLSKFVELSGGKLPWIRLWPMSSPILTALGKIHEHGIVHKDVSPDNIMVRSSDGSMVLLDFGAAQQTTSGKTEHSVNLKPGYAPLEAYSTVGQQDARTDEYAMMATLYYALTGKQPENPLNIVTGVERLTPPTQIGGDIPTESEKVLLKGMSIKIEDRYPTMEALLNAFEKAQQTGYTMPVSSYDMHQLEEKESVSYDIKSTDDTENKTQINPGTLHKESGHVEEKASEKNKPKNTGCMSLLRHYLIRILVVVILSFFGINRFSPNYTRTNIFTNGGSSYRRITTAPSFTPTPISTIYRTPTPTPKPTATPTPITGSAVKQKLKIVFNGLAKMSVDDQELIDIVDNEELTSIQKYPTENEVFVPYLRFENTVNIAIDFEMTCTVSRNTINNEYSFDRRICEPGELCGSYVGSEYISGGETITWYVNGESFATYDVPVKQSANVTSWPTVTPKPISTATSKASINKKEFSEHTLDSFRKLEEGPVYLPIDGYRGDFNIFRLEMADGSQIEEATVRYVSGSSELKSLFDILHSGDNTYICFNEYKGVGTATFEVFAESKTGTASERLTVSVSKKADLKPVKQLKTELNIKVNEKIDLSSVGIISNPEQFSEDYYIQKKISDDSYSWYAYHQMTADEPYELSSGQFVASEAGTYYILVKVSPSINLVQQIIFKIIVTQSDDSGKTDSDNADVAVRATCTANQVNIRKKPSMNAGTVGQINKGDVVVVIGQQGEWSQIRSGTKEGYIKTQYIDFNGNGSYTNIKALWKDMDILIDGWKPKEGSFTVKLKDLNNGMKYDEARFNYYDKSGKFRQAESSIISNQILFTGIKDLDASESYDIELFANNPDGVRIVSNVGEHEMDHASFTYRKAHEIFDHELSKSLYVSFESGILSSIAYEDEKFYYLCLKSNNFEMLMDNSHIYAVDIYDSNGEIEKELRSYSGHDLSSYAKYFDEAKTLKWKDGDFIIQ